MTLPDDKSSPESRSATSRRSQSAAKTAPKTAANRPAERATEDTTDNSIASAGQRLQAASTQMQEQSDKLTQAVHEHWPDGRKPATSNTAAEPANAESNTSEKNQENQNSETAIADVADSATTPAVPSNEKNAEKTAALSNEKSDEKSDAKNAEYGRQDTLNQPAILHPRVIWPD